VKEATMTSKEHEDHFSWTAQKGLLTIGLFVVQALVSEFFIIFFFVGSGLIEVAPNPLATSLLFYVLPLAVIVVLVSSWMYLTKQVALGPRVTASVKASKSKRKRPRRRTRQSATQRTFGKIKKGFNRVVTLFSGSGGVSVTQRRLSFSRVALESIITVLTVFLLSVILLSVLVYPRLFTDFATEFYSTNSAFQEFTVSIMGGISGVLAPIRELAPSLRNAFGGLVTVRAQSFSSGDILLRYVLCQNVAAWVSAFVALAYARFFSKTYRPLKK
jgi:hypothetical protein